MILYSFQLNDERDWYRTGTHRPPFTNGDTVEFEYVVDPKGSRNVVIDTILKVAAQEVQAAPAVKTVSKQENWDARAKYWQDKEQRDIEIVEPRITLAAARSAAIEVVGLALAHDAIPFGNANKGARLGIILDAVDEVTNRYFHESLSAHTRVSGAKPEAAAKPDYNDELPED